MNRNPFDTEYDVVVLGGGMSGLGAALSIAAADKRVLLVERRQALGWEVTSAFKCSFRKSDAPTAERVRKRLSAIGGLRGDRVDAPFLEYVLDQMIADAGIDLLFYSQPTDLLIDGDLATGVTIGNKSGEQRVRAKAYVDATEGAILWRQAHTDWPENWDARPAVGAVFFNMITAGVELPHRLGNLDELHEMVAYPSVREREVCIEYTLPHYSIPETRLVLDRVVSHVREAVPGLRDAIVTHASFEPYPLGPAVIRTGDPAPVRRPRNLFAAGIWAVRDGAAWQKTNTIAGRLGWGEAVGIEVLQTLADLPRPSPGDISNNTAEPPTVEADVIVAGGGTAGSLAAIAAGRQGAKVILLEMSTVLGGMVTSGGVSWEGHGVKGGLQDEYYEREARRRALYSGAYDSPRVHPESGKIALDAMCREAGVEVVYGAAAVGAEMATVGAEMAAVGAEMDGSRIRGVIAATPRGKIIYRGEVVIDSTGDADVARMAGAPTEIGRETDGVIHAYTQSSMILYPNGKMRPSNHDCGYVDSFDVVDLTRGRREGIRQMHARWHRGLLGERRLLYHCPLIGLRQGLRVVGDYSKSMLEQIQPVHYEDTIAYAGAKYDCHSQDFENQQDLPVLWVWMLGNRERHIGGEIPYRSLLPKNVEGMLVACRSASSTNEAAYQFRVIRNMNRIGEAAGIAAAICSELDATPREIDVQLVRRELFDSGALGDEVHPGPVVPERPLDELAGVLVSDDPKDAVWLLAQGGEDARRLLQETVREGPLGARFWASVALAWHRDPEAVPELVNCVSERGFMRTDFTPIHRNTVPLWQSSIVMLGRIGDPRAVPVLLEVLEDRSVGMDPLIAAIRALGRIGEAERTVPALLELLTRDDLPRERLFQQTNLESRWPAGEDGLWQLELAAAEVLAGFGHPQVQIVEKYLADPRTYVRRYAAMVKARSQRRA